MLLLNLSFAAFESISRVVVVVVCRQHGGGPPATASVHAGCHRRRRQSRQIDPQEKYLQDDLTVPMTISRFTPAMLKRSFEGFSSSPFAGDAAAGAGVGAALLELAS